MKTIIGLFVAVVAVAALSSFCTLRWMESRRARAVDPHEWLHSELKITPAQHAALEPIEAKFAEQNRVLRERLRAANHELGGAIRKGRSDSPEITAAVGKIHVHMRELQKASIDHIFEMRSVLTPEQGDKLLQLAEKGLDVAP
ncbi:MAG: periplasmic heavy metal sensor [Opitutaceae bacterium]|nr:periplasmic heavy metal sensor [Opitutaceae bacterium]